MAVNPQKERKSNDLRGKNLILVSNNSELFSEVPPSMLFPRSSSRHHIDYHPPPLFQSFQQPEKGGKEKNDARLAQDEPIDLSQKYAQECLEYEKYLYDEKTRLIIHRMAIICYHSFRERNDHPFFSFFIERLLSALAKKLLMNKFQLLFLEYIFEQTKWKYDLDGEWAHEFKSYVHFYQSETPSKLVHNLQAYLLFCSYYSKKSLNQSYNQAIFNVFLRTVSDRFKERYQEWTELSGITKMKINPKLLNSIYRKLTSFQEKEKDYFENYNLIVEEILEISPAYNADKQKKGRKKRKTQQEAIRQPESNNNLPEPRHLRSPIQEDSPPEFPPIPFRKKQTSYVSNVDGLDPVAYFNRNS